MANRLYGMRVPMNGMRGTEPQQPSSPLLQSLVPVAPFALAEDYSVDFRAWYEPLKPFTFPTFFLQLSQHELDAIAAFFDEFFPVYFPALQHQHPGTPVGDPTMSWLDATQHICPSRSRVAELEALAARVDGLLPEAGLQGADFFVKLSTRAPKDALALRRRQESGGWKQQNDCGGAERHPMACRT